jgi:Uma2 family endonuclease
MELSLSPTQRYTYADYLTWTDDLRRELVDGFIKLFMTPAPVSIHQDIALNLGSWIHHYIRKHNGQCRVYIAPFDVRFPKTDISTGEIPKPKKGAKYNKEFYTVVQPDICIICDPEKIDKYGCVGAPDFICEITSTIDPEYDRTTKFALYERYKVKEYWIVDPVKQLVDCYYLSPKYGGTYEQTGHYENKKMPDAIIPLKTFSDCEIEIKEIFEM